MCYVCIYPGSLEIPLHNSDLAIPPPPPPPPTLRSTPLTCYLVASHGGTEESISVRAAGSPTHHSDALQKELVGEGALERRSGGKIKSRDWEKSEGGLEMKGKRNGNRREKTRINIGRKNVGGPKTAK